jgi:hypothetical protein
MKKTQLASCFIIAGFLGVHQLARAADPAHPDQPIVSPGDAIARLKQGNGRFTAENPQHPHKSVDERNYMAANSYENPGAIPWASLASRPPNDAQNSRRVSIRLRSSSVVPIRVCRPKSSLMKGSEICSLFE